MSVSRDQDKDAEQFRSRKVQSFMMARPSTLSFRMLLKQCFKMKVVKRHCLEDKVEANYLFRFKQ